MRRFEKKTIAVYHRHRRRHHQSNRDILRRISGIKIYHTFRYAIAGKGQGSPYSITERRVPEVIPVLGSQPAGDVSHKPSSRLPLLSARPAVTPAILKRAANDFAAW